MNIAVLGAGSGGQCMAAHLGLLGNRVSLYDIDGAKIAALQKRGEITVSGVVEGSYRPAVITADVGQAIEGAQLVMVVTTTDGHRDLAAAMAPYIRDDMTVVLNPGHTGGSMEVSAVLAQAGKNPVVAEMQDLIYTCRQKEVGDIAVPAMKKKMDLAAYPASKAAEVLGLLETAYPQLETVPSILHTGFDNLSALIHPAPTVLNAGRAESGESYDYYGDGITPAVARVLEDMDRERLAVAAAYGVEATSIPQWQKNAYGVEGDSYYQIFQNNASYRGIKANNNLDNRFLTEDVPCGLVPLSALGALAKVPTPVLDSMIGICSSILGRDFTAEGRTLERLGLSGMTVADIKKKYL